MRVRPDLHTAAVTVALLATACGARAAAHARDGTGRVAARTSETVAPGDPTSGLVLAVPAALATVTAARAAAIPGEPVLVVVLDAMHDLPPALAPDARFLRGELAREVAAVAGALEARRVPTLRTDEPGGALAPEERLASACACALDSLDAIARDSADPRGEVALLRGLVLEGLADGPARDRYADERDRLLGAVDEYDRAVQDRGRAIAEGALRYAAHHSLRAVALVAGGHYAATIARRAADAGAGVVVAEPHFYGRLVRDYALWLADLRARVPAPADDEDGLPALAPWIDVLRPYAEALGDAPDLHVAPGAPLGPDDALSAAVARAADRLAAALPAAPLAAAVVGDPRATLAGVALCYGYGGDALARADGTYLLTTPAAKALDGDELAALLAHELVHVRDLEQIAGALGRAPGAVPALIAELPAAARAGLELVLQDRAYRVELEVAAALGLRPPGAAAAGDASAARRAAASAARRYRESLAAFRAARSDPVRWLDAIYAPPAADRAPSP